MSSRGAAAVLLLNPGLPGWDMAGPGGFREVEPGTVESYGGSGVFWYAERQFADFILTAEWRVRQLEDNSGIFLRIPALGEDPQPAIEHGYEVQIDERGINPEAGTRDLPDRLTGAIYKLAPAVARASRPVGEWNSFRIVAAHDEIAVELNGKQVSQLRKGQRTGRATLVCRTITLVPLSSSAI